MKNEILSDKCKLIHELKNQGIRDSKVLEAIKKVDRKDFVAEEHKSLAYANKPLPIPKGQTISQPLIVAIMLEALELKDTDRVLEIGTGSAYNAALLSQLAKEVYSIEKYKLLAKSAQNILKKHKYHNIHVRHGDGFNGWPEKAPFDKIVLTASPEEIPKTLIEQLKPGGILVGPEGKIEQNLVKIRKLSNSLKKEKICPVLFVEMN